MTTIQLWHVAPCSRVEGGGNCARVLLTGLSPVAKTALNNDLWVVPACQRQLLEVSSPSLRPQE